jgi:hypothetical protein
MSTPSKRHLSGAGRIDLAKDSLLEEVIQGQRPCTCDTSGLSAQISHGTNLRMFAPAPRISEPAPSCAITCLNASTVDLYCLTPLDCPPTVIIIRRRIVSNG